MLRIYQRTTLRRGAGFILIEQLVAITIIAVTLAAIGALVSATTRGAGRIERQVALLQASNSLLSTVMPPRDGSVAPSLSGVSWGHRWRMILGAAQADPALVLRQNGRWVPMRVELLVQAPSGPLLRLQTMRLQRIRSQ
ncbi:type II secretion system protein [Bradyrhizobium sp. INPA01-394B]|uniref:Type II secretion system protein n=1 Tax=Bradyrhizobium campsiandrae TaxID=1729892 RepID=A0ABR7UAX3_9BRAD|nr:type II secretion system protein [Bradyrhizobium campsiandrae]MBC9879620.1 type II secretion system protein [Bradyrhizobium campsiandrae]MBC9980775.1 type II secretion system protein [Bradyrhizobium campsiandrae]